MPSHHITALTYNSFCRKGVCSNPFSRKSQTRKDRNKSAQQLVQIEIPFRPSRLMGARHGWLVDRLVVQINISRQGHQLNAEGLLGVIFQVNDTA
ncbi:hypothetical protein TNCV_301101 [Trichonephila clavipes]|nr:hypothetical protein TNCV_301101 [Trichonephila clavipes]